MLTLPRPGAINRLRQRTLSRPAYQQMVSIALGSGRQLLVGTVPDLPSAVWTVTKDVQFIAPSLGKGKGGGGGGCNGGEVTNENENY